MLITHAEESFDLMSLIVGAVVTFLRDFDNVDVSDPQALFLGEGNKPMSNGHASSVGSFANIKMNGPEVYRFAVSAVPSVRSHARSPMFSLAS